MTTKYPTATTHSGQYRQVFLGRADSMPSGLTARDLVMNSRGRVVSKAKSKLGKANVSGINLWRRAIQEVCDEEGVSYTIPTKGTSLYRKVRERYEEYA